jgi:hypothetical protein
MSENVETSAGRGYGLGLAPTSRMSIAESLATAAAEPYENLLQDANDLIHGPRPADYSHPSTTSASRPTSGRRGGRAEGC